MVTKIETAAELRRMLKGCVTTYLIVPAGARFWRTRVSQADAVAYAKTVWAGGGHDVIVKRDEWTTPSGGAGATARVRCARRDA